jgi:hypothetical protein
MPKAARRRSDNVLTMPSTEPPTAVPLASEISQGDIARRAFELYCDRGRQDGHDVDDWLNAQRELREAIGSTAA